MSEAARSPAAALERLVTIMAKLRDPMTGCAWDVAQTWASIAPYTIEEAYEVADAITRGDAADLKDELGDLLLQVVFHSRIAEEAGLFALSEVATAIADKMERRHPHIFDPGAVGHADWEQVKAAERAAQGLEGTLAGVAAGLPALTRAEKLQRRASCVGFDWPDAAGPRAKLAEEMVEVDTASPDDQAEEVGDLLFAAVNWARHLGIDAEAALRQANAKFERRFAAMEKLAAGGFASLPPAQQEALWGEVKRRGG